MKLNIDELTIIKLSIEGEIESIDKRIGELMPKYKGQGRRVIGNIVDTLKCDKIELKALLSRLNSELFKNN